MNYSYEFVFSDSFNIEKIFRFNESERQEIDVLKFLKPELDDWSDIFTCKCYMTPTRVIIYKEKFPPVIEEDWFRLHNSILLNALYRISMAFVNISQQLDQDIYNSWYSSFIYESEDEPIICDNIEVHQNTHSEREYLVIKETDIFYKSYFTYRRKDISEYYPIEVGDYNTIIFYPFFFKKINKKDCYISNNMPLGFNIGYNSFGYYNNYSGINFDVDWDTSLSTKNTIETEIGYSTIKEETIFNLAPYFVENQLGSRFAYNVNSFNGISVFLWNDSFFPRVELDKFNVFNR